MKIAAAREYGSPDQVRVEEMLTPTPEADEVLVRVRAASVNRADLDSMYPRWQFTRLFLGLRRPRLPWLGIDVAGTVEANGPEARRFKPGDDVFADIFSHRKKGGAFAEFVCVPEKALATMPSTLSHEEAATLPHSAVLAIMGLQPRGARKFGAGTKVMIVGASGNVGPFLVQIAKSRGAEVTAVASAQKADFVRSLGADHVIDYKTTDPRRTDERFDLIVDVDAHLGVLSWRNSLKPGGVYCAMGGSASWLLRSVVGSLVARLMFGKRMGLLVGWSPFPDKQVAELRELVAAGAVKPQIDRRFTLAETADALRYVDQRKSRGKVVIIP
jgi:NADPH:quinone reductase-like Zn-dependent oxidoreductase